MIYLENYPCSTSRTDECTKRSEAPRRAGWRECGPMGAQWLALLLAGALRSDEELACQAEVDALLPSLNVFMVPTLYA